jgi:hypothetical protein
MAKSPFPGLGKGDLPMINSVWCLAGPPWALTKLPWALAGRTGSYQEDSRDA